MSEGSAVRDIHLSNLIVTKNKGKIFRIKLFLNSQFTGRRDIHELEQHF